MRRIAILAATAAASLTLAACSGSGGDNPTSSASGNAPATFQEQHKGGTLKLLAKSAGGSLDPWLKNQTRVAEKRYQELGGRITIITKEGEGHYPLAPKEQQPVVDFIIKRVAAAGSPSNQYHR